MSLLSAKMNNMTTAIVHDERHAIITFGITLLNLLCSRIALLLDYNGSWRESTIKFKIALIVFQSIS